MPNLQNISIPENIEDAPTREKLKFLMYIHLTHRNFDPAKTADVDLDTLLDYVYAVNRILENESHAKVRIIALEVLHQIIDVILKYFSSSFMTSLKLSERLMLVSIIVKRNCFPLVCMPARQPKLNLDYLQLKSENTNANDEKLNKLKTSSFTNDETSNFVTSAKVSDDALSKSVKNTINRVKLKLLTGIEWSDFASMSLDEMQAVSMLMNDKDLVLTQVDDKLTLLQNDDSRGIVQSESKIFTPKDIQ